MDLLGGIGGLQSALVMLGLLLVGFLTQKTFLSSIIKEIYQVKHSRGNSAAGSKTKVFKEESPDLGFSP